MSDVFVVLIVILIFINGVSIGLSIGSRQAKKEVYSPAPAQTEDDLEKIRKEREEMKAEQKAFVNMMGYNADVAYGLNKSPFEGS